MATIALEPGDFISIYEDEAREEFPNDFGMRYLSVCHMCFSAFRPGSYSKR